MKQHTVRRGECVSSIAAEHGFFPDTLWNAPENAALRERRADPNVLVAGDVVVVPDLDQRVEACATGALHRFRRRGVPEKLRFQFLSDGEPRAGEQYDLSIDGVLIAEAAVTDEEGRIEHWIPPGARTAVVRLIETEEECVFALGSLEPAETLRGVQARLKSLGFFAGTIDGTPSEDLRTALASYQVARDLEPTGEPDSATQSRLKDDYGT